MFNRTPLTPATPTTPSLIVPSSGASEDQAPQPANPTITKQPSKGLKLSVSKTNNIWNSPMQKSSVLYFTEFAASQNNYALMN